MANKLLEGKIVFVDCAYDKVKITNGMKGLAWTYLENLLKMKIAPDNDDPTLRLEQRFINSRAEIAFISAIPYLNQIEEIAGSKILKAKGVVLTRSHSNFSEINNKLLQSNFLTLDIKLLSVNQISPLVSLLQTALGNVAN